jgi:hypothetical protein
MKTMVESLTKGRSFVNRFFCHGPAAGILWMPPFRDLQGQKKCEQFAEQFND